MTRLVALLTLFLIFGFFHDSSAMNDKSYANNNTPSPKKNVRFRDVLSDDMVINLKNLVREYSHDKYERNRKTLEFMDKFDDAQWEESFTGKSKQEVFNVIEEEKFEEFLKQLKELKKNYKDNVDEPDTPDEPEPDVPQSPPKSDLHVLPLGLMAAFSVSVLVALYYLTIKSKKGSKKKGLIW